MSISCSTTAFLRSEFIALPLLTLAQRLNFVQRQRLGRYWYLLQSLCNSWLLGSWLWEIEREWDGKAGNLEATSVVWRMVMPSEKQPFTRSPPPLLLQMGFQLHLPPMLIPLQRDPFALPKMTMMVFVTSRINPKSPKITRSTFFFKDDMVWRTNKFMDNVHVPMDSSPNMQIWECCLLCYVPVSFISTIPPI